MRQKEVFLFRGIRGTGKIGGPILTLSFCYLFFKTMYCTDTCMGGKEKRMINTSLSGGYF